MEETRPLRAERVQHERVDYERFDDDLRFCDDEENDRNWPLFLLIAFSSGTLWRTTLATPLSFGTAWLFGPLADGTRSMGWWNPQLILFTCFASMLGAIATRRLIRESRDLWAAAFTCVALALATGAAFGAIMITVPIFGGPIRDWPVGFIMAPMFGGLMGVCCTVASLHVAGPVAFALVLVLHWALHRNRPPARDYGTYEYGSYEGRLFAIESRPDARPSSFH